MPAEARAVEAVGLTKRFGPGHLLTRLASRQHGRRVTRVLDGCDLAVDRGELVAVTGANGSGKSTLLRILATIVAPTAGTARVAGFDIVGADVEVRRRTSLVPADDRMFSVRLTGRENLEFHARLLGVGRSRRAEAVDDAFVRVDLRACADDPYGVYSTGMRQRLAIARSLVQHPEVILLDEPFRGLDADHRRAVASLLAGVAAVDGTAIVAATHDLDPLQGSWTQVLRLEEGVLLPGPRAARPVHVP